MDHSPPTDDPTDDPADAPEHDELAALLPWWINGTLEPDEAARVAAHVADCGPCEAERGRLETVLNREPPPMDALQNTDDALASVFARIDAESASAEAAPAGTASDAGERSRTAEPGRSRAGAVPQRGRPDGDPTWLDRLLDTLFAFDGRAVAAVAVAGLALAILATGPGDAPDGPAGAGGYTVLGDAPTAAPPPPFTVTFARELEPERALELVVGGARAGMGRLTLSPVGARTWRVEFADPAPPETVLSILESLDRSSDVVSVEGVQ